MVDPNAHQQTSLLTSLTQRWLGWRNWASPAVQAQKSPVVQRVGERFETGENRSGRRAWPGKWPDSADLLSQRMASLQIDSVDVRSTLPELTREAEHACALCLDRFDCRNDLDRGGTNSAWVDRCPNAGLLLAVSARRGAAS